MQQRQNVVGSVPRVNATLLEEIAVALLPLVEISLPYGQNVFGIDFNEVISVRPRMLVHEVKGVKQLMNWGHQVVLETVAGKTEISSHWKTLSLLLPVQIEFLNAPSSSQLAAALKTVLDENIVVNQLHRLSEGDAGHLGGDVSHCSKHDLLARSGEGVKEFKLDHLTWPQPTWISQVGVEGSLVSTKGGFTDIGQ